MTGLNSSVAQSRRAHSKTNAALVCYIWHCVRRRRDLSAAAAAPSSFLLSFRLVLFVSERAAERASERARVSLNGRRDDDGGGGDGGRRIGRD